MWLGFPSLALLLAQPQTASDAEPKPPVFYETTTVTARPVSGASGAVTVVSSDELATRGARSGSDVLREVPGLNFLASGERAGVTNAWVRGADPNFTLVLLDGIPLNDSTELQGGAVNLEELSADLVGHAEVVRGPLTSFYGPNSLSGVVQLFAPRGGPGPFRLAAGARPGSAPAATKSHHAPAFSSSTRRARGDVRLPPAGRAAPSRVRGDGAGAAGGHRPPRAGARPPGRLAPSRAGGRPHGRPLLPPGRPLARGPRPPGP